MGNLKLALEAVYRNELDRLPQETELEQQIYISPAFERKMQKMIHSQTMVRPGQRVKRMLMVAVLAALMASAMSVQAIKDPIVNFLLDVYERCTDIIFQTIDDTAEEYAFFIPEPPKGYEETNREEFETQVKAEYSSKDGNYLRYTQYLLDGMMLSVDTEDASVKVDKIQGYTIFVYSKNGFNSVVWSDGVFGYKLNATGSILELRNIAEKIIKENK